MPISRHHSIKLYGSTGVSTRTGSDPDAVGILLQYRRGPGLQARPMAGRFDAGPAHWPALNLLASQLLKAQPISLQLRGRYNADKLPGGPDWGLRANITFLFPK